MLGAISASPQRVICIFPVHKHEQPPLSQVRILLSPLPAVDCFADSAMIVSWYLMSQWFPWRWIVISQEHWVWSSGCLENQGVGVLQGT